MSASGKNDSNIATSEASYRVLGLACSCMRLHLDGLRRLPVGEYPRPIEDRQVVPCLRNLRENDDVRVADVPVKDLKMRACRSKLVRYRFAG